MQERRGTLRIPFKNRTQYCPAEDFLPRDGQLMNLSERGAGLFARKAHQVGERITLSVQLPGEDREPVIATGVVRWCGSSRLRGRWWPHGLEWLPMEEATRHRLHRFLYTSGAKPPPAAPPGPALLEALARYTLVALGTFAVGLAVLWVLALQEHNRQLQAVAEERRAVIAALEHRERRLSAELGYAQRRLEETSGEASRLNQYAVALTDQMGSLQRNVQQAQASYQQLEQSYATIRQEREQLMQRVLDLEQGRAQLTAKLASVRELRLAIQETIDRRKEERQAARLAEIEARHAAEEEWLATGNRGYLVHEGQPTAGGPTVWIRIHDPETAASTGPDLHLTPVSGGAAPAAARPADSDGVATLADSDRAVQGP